jgi:hypothetical protein
VTKLKIEKRRRDIEIELQSEMMSENFQRFTRLAEIDGVGF